MHQPGLKGIALQGHKSTGDTLLEQEMSGFWFRLGAKDNGRLTFIHGNCPCHWRVPIGLRKPISKGFMPPLFM
ncbi:hypothetical protein CEXT_615251 [Caerostris extrusa]|uniref:Uncharacterized protein n=1 Tax=Caerostris extrusa TaxID=172846 RepID=A0AAV4PQX0_CAEEX|nr:hypothetical protein CEXT_615251 [Caerostris extrusa]